MKKYIVLFIIILILMGLSLFGGVVGINTIRSKRALEKAHSYVSQVYQDFTIVGAICQGQDVDQDGYVSCDVRIKNTTETKTIIIQCPTLVRSYLGTSCKQARAILQ